MNGSVDVATGLQCQLHCRWVCCPVCLSPEGQILTFGSDPSSRLRFNADRSITSVSLDDGANMSKQESTS